MTAPELATERLVAYLVQAIARAAEVYTSRALSDPAHALALGEAVALFNLADEFGLIAAVRQQVDARLGRDVYRGLSEAMKRYYLGGSQATAGSGARQGSQPPRSPNRDRRPPPSAPRAEPGPGRQSPPPSRDQRRRPPPTR